MQDTDLIKSAVFQTLVKKLNRSNQACYQVNSGILSYVRRLNSYSAIVVSLLAVTSKV